MSAATNGATGLETVREFAADAIVWAQTPTGLLVLAGAAALLVALGVLFLLSRVGPNTGAPTFDDLDAPPLPGGRAIEAKVLLLKLAGDDGAALTRLAAVTSMAFGDHAEVVRGPALGGKVDQDLAAEMKRARGHAAKARAALTVWGAVDGDVLRLRFVAHAGREVECFALPVAIAAPYDTAFAGIAASLASGGPIEKLSDSLGRAKVNLGLATERFGSQRDDDGALLGSGDEAAQLHAALARVSLALTVATDDVSYLDTALISAREADRAGRRRSDPLEWAETQALRAAAIEAGLRLSAEPDPELLRERIDALRAVGEVWVHAGASARAASAGLTLAEALLDFADRGGEVGVLDEAERLAERGVAAFASPAGGAGSRAAQRLGLLGAIRVRLGEREPRVARLEAAEQDMRRAVRLAEDAGDRMLAARLRPDLARAVARLGERDPGAERLRAAAELYRGVLGFNPGALQALDALGEAGARAALGAALSQIGERDRDAVAADEAVTALRLAAHAFTDAGASAAAARARRTLERAERLYAELRATRGMAQEG